ncbi:MAG: hypothetical protein ACFFAU_16205 [Candidatus Hodarchaeota archaeon]
MRENEPKVTASKDKITISFSEKMRLGPLHNIIEGYLELNRDQQRQLEDVMESLLQQNENLVKYSEPFVSDASFANFTENQLRRLDTKKKRILYIMNNKSHPNYFNAPEVKELYEVFLKEPIGISTIQTNLNRLVDEGLVERQEGSSPLLYRANKEKAHEIQRILI